MVESILKKAPSLPQALRELIVGDAEGNPFYIEEIIKMLIDQKVIVPGRPEWHIEADRLAAARLPPTLTGVLQARLDGLPPIERAVLQRASVIGRVFWDSGVERLSSPAGFGKAAETAAGPALSGTQVAQALAGLRHKEIVFRRESSAFAGAVEYTFKHELLRNVSYESLLKKSRREYHSQVAAWFIESRGERVNEFGGLVAAHFEHAGRFAEAADWYGRAGQQARTSYAPAIAIDYFRKALALLPTAPPEASQEHANRLEWQEGLGEMLGAQAKFSEALEA
jgi:predicted ATPase